MLLSTNLKKFIYFANFPKIHVAQTIKYFNVWKFFRDKKFFSEDSC